MKNFILIFGLLLAFCNNAQAIEGKDVNKYDILNEADYAVLIYDLKKSLINQLNDNNFSYAEAHAAFIIGNLDLLQLKKQTIKFLKQKKLHILKDNIDTATIEQINHNFGQVIQSLLYTIKELEYTDALIYMYMQTPEFYYKPWINHYSKALLYNAGTIAISRFDNHYWFNNIKNCYNNSYNKKQEAGNRVEVIVECSRKYQQLISQEINLVLIQLEPYKLLYEWLPQINSENNN